MRRNNQQMTQVQMFIPS